MGNRTLVMPVKIFVMQSNYFDGKEAAYNQFYGKNGEPFFPMTDYIADSKGPKVDFNEELYCELISVSTKEEARQFIEQHPDLRFAYHRRPDIRKTRLEEYETLDRYCEFMVTAVKQHNDLRRFEILRQREQIAPAPEWHQEMLRIYEEHFRTLNQNSAWANLSGMRAHFFDIHGRVDAATEKMMNAGSNAGLSYKELEEEYFADHDDLRRQHNEKVQEQIDSIVAAKMNEDVSHFIDAINRDAVITYDADSLTLQCQCPTLLTALYLMLFVSIHNQDEYALCAHPKCHMYFKVDKIHPQKMCDRHMRARRKKRVNYRKHKDTDDYSKQTDDD